MSSFFGLKTVTKTGHRHIFDEAIGESLHSLLDSLDEQSCSRNNSLSSVIGTVEDQLKKKDIKCKDPFSKLVGFGADDASVNPGIKESVRPLLLEKCPWLFSCWCFAHRLELAVADAFKDTQFEEIEEILVNLFYLYKRSPERFTELKDIFESLKRGFKFR